MNLDGSLGARMVLECHDKDMDEVKLMAFAR